MNKAYPSSSNPGPSWGYRSIAFWERVLPDFLFRFVLGLGTLIGLCFMKRQRLCGREFWMQATGKKPTFFQQYRHFRSFMDGLILKLQAGRSKFPDFQFAETAHSESFENLCRSDHPAIFGTFHVGHSDMMGCMLRDFGRKISMVRLKVENSHDTDEMERIFSDSVRILWINDPEELMFSLKKALQEGESLALQCDRSEYSSRTSGFKFLGKNRKFPMAIYHLSYLFHCPVVFAFTGPLERNGLVRVHTSKVFHPVATKKEHLKMAIIHYQQVIGSLEEHLRRYPELWFNFIPIDQCFPKADDSHDG